MARRPPQRVLLIQLRRLGDVVLTAALFERFASRELDRFQNQVLSAMRFGFGGHLEKSGGKMV